MNPNGPPLEALTRRLAECPAEFLAEPAIGKRGSVNVVAVVADLLYDLGGGQATPQALAAFTQTASGAKRNHLKLVLVTCWLLHAPWFCEHGRHDQGRLARMTLPFLQLNLAQLSEALSAEQCVHDPDRREELVRFCLKALNLIPAGETPAQAQDRLSTLDSAERQRVVKATRQAEARAQEIRRKMAEEEARRAEAKTMPE